MSEPRYDVVVIGGGPAGLTTALYTTRLGHRTAVVEKEGGRHAAVSHVHNLLGVSEAVSGSELSEHGVRQLETYGGDFYPDAVERVERVDGEEGSADGYRFRVEASRGTLAAERVVFATGFRDLPPEVSGLRRFTGRGLHYCLHCDAYALGDAPVFVLGHDEHAAHVAMTMCNFTDDVDLLLDGRDPEWDEETGALVEAHPIERVDAEVVSVYADGEAEEDEPRLGGLSFADGADRDYRGGFAMYGTEYASDLAADLGCDLDGDGAVAVDERRETSVEGAYAVGDVTHGQNQTTIAIGDGARAGIAIHKDLRPYPKSLDELAGESADADGPPGAPPDLRARMRRLRDLEPLPGLREPRPETEE
ncbi:NAD(P)/FAD-dependent oxidoreductase [Salinilacihabitans rarus]|uniref:NAD(P)/FAD-dependent oxidoreductase n=1 Tax=Salinilacihabitans rarus TaxID=2961596 RepID=UPI0020C8B937|nr:NAD(P)/FAD-dependent oxidoreductase [Salinilacihabitans rarus]